MALAFRKPALKVLKELRDDAGREPVLRAVEKALRLIQSGDVSGGLNPKPYHGIRCPHKRKLYEAYAQNQTPGAWRIWFCRCEGPLIVAIGPHP